MQETKSLIYNVNTENNGNDKLKDRLENEFKSIYSNYGR